jgi:hypothetical protein
VSPKLLAATLLAAMVLAPATAASAHGGNGGATSDYRIEVTGFEGDSAGIEVRPVELGNRMELVRTSAHEVQILGYEGEPYLRLDADGVFENVNSPAHFINLDRFARQQPPASARADAEPDWVKLSDGASVRWHDHRTHWMDPTPRQDVRDDPGVERVIFPANRVDLVVDGRPVTAIVRVTWLPPPPRTTWLIVSSLVACAILGALVLLPSLRGAAPALATIAAVGAVVGSGSSGFRLVVGLVAVTCGIAGWVLGNRWLSGAAALVAVVFAVTHFEVFEHQLLAGWAPAVLQRIGITVALAFGAAVVGRQVVGELGATQPTEAEPVMAET